MLQTWTIRAAAELGCYKGAEDGFEWTDSEPECSRGYNFDSCFEIEQRAVRRWVQVLDQLLI